MDKELKQKWVAALRSGEYRQGRHYLKSTEYGEGEVEYCCLGVLNQLADCKLAADEQWLKVDISGLSQETQATLVSMNDSQNKTFSEIANYIETNL